MVAWRTDRAERVGEGAAAEPASTALGAFVGSLSPQRACLYAMALYLTTFLPYAVLVGRAIWAGTFPLFTDGEPIGGDFASHLLGGRILLHGDLGHLYDLDYQRVEWHGWLPRAAVNPFVSPPFMAAVYAPLSALPYGVALTIWTILSVAMIVVSLRLLWPLVPHLHRLGRRSILVQLLLAPPALYVLLGGQDSAFSLLLLVGGLRLLRAGRPVTAGALLGLGVFKPQLIAVIPILLLAQRRWRALAGWTGVAGALAASSMALVGSRGVHDYLALPGSDFYRTNVVEGKGWEMQSFVAFARVLLPGRVHGAVAPLTLVVAAIALGTLVVTAHRARHDDEGVVRLYALAALAIPFVSPHLFLYDCLVLAIPALVLLDTHLHAAAVRWALIAGSVLLWTTPYRHFAVETASWPATLVAAPWALIAILVWYRVLLDVVRRRGVIAHASTPIAASVATAVAEV